MTDADRLFRDFFRNEMPAPFPPCAATTPPAAPKRGESQWAARAALAASVAALVAVGAFVAPGRGPAAPSAPAGGMMNDATAHGKGLLEKAEPKPPLPPMPELPMP